MCVHYIYIYVYFCIYDNIYMYTYTQVRRPEQQNIKGSGRLLAQRGASKILEIQIAQTYFRIYA